MDAGPKTSKAAKVESSTLTGPWATTIICGDPKMGDAMLIRRILSLLLVLCVSQGVPAVIQVADTTELLKTADELLQTVTKLRGLEPKSSILKGIRSRAEISQYLNERVHEDYSENDLQAEEKVLRKLGLIPASINYKEFVLKLLTEQVGGYYDPDKKTLYIAAWLTADEQKPVLVHELTHALQDQHFDVGRILKENRKLRNDDRTLAHQAVLEGDGMVVMLQYLLEPIKRHFSQLPDLAFIMQAQMASMQSQYAVFKNAPPYLRESLLFPYGYGAAFLQKAWLKNPSWEAVNKIYSDLPASTEQIIHPEKYLNERDNPKSVPHDDPAARIGKGWKITYRNVLGEFSLSLLLDLHLTEERARRSVSGWGGDQVSLLENAEGKNAVFVNTVWDTPEDAEKFYLAIQDWFQKGYPRAIKTDEPPGGFSLVQDGEFHSVRHRGDSVRFIVGQPEADARDPAKIWGSK